MTLSPLLGFDSVIAVWKESAPSRADAAVDRTRSSNDAGCSPSPALSKLELELELELSGRQCLS